MEINDTLLESVPLMEFSRFSGMSAAYLCRVKKNKIVVSEAMYNKIRKHLTDFINSDSMDTVKN
jgi:hypothetical protein